MKHFDTIIIGFGKAGKTLAAYQAQQGKSVALVEKNPAMFGGTCINVGCIPSKSLIHHAIMAAQHPHWDFVQKQSWYSTAIKEKEALVKQLRQKNFDKLNQLEKVEVLVGTASFLSSKVILVETSDHSFEITADQIFINTGSTPILPDIEGILDNPNIYTSDGLMQLKSLPKSLVIVGGGYIGLEFASMYSLFGSQVTVLQNSKTLIPKEDRDIAEAIQNRLRDLGVQFKLGSSIHQFERLENQTAVHYTWNNESCIEHCDAVLIATGRKANTEALHLDKAGIQTDSRGSILVDDQLKTNVKNIWALGDVKGGLQFTYISLDDFRIIRSQLEGKNYTLQQRHFVPYSVFLSPAFSRIGLNEEEARKANHSIRVFRLPAAAIPKAHVLKNPSGILKAIVDTETEQILGAMLFCEESYEMINLIKLAMDSKLPYSVLRDQIFTHPTMSEALNDLFS